MSLSVEIHQIIWSFLNVKSIGRSKRVCKYWNRNLDENVYRLICERLNYNKPKGKSYQWCYLSKQPFTAENFTGVGKLLQYEGDFIQGKRTGFGIEIKNNHRYEGDWLNDMLDGNGTYFWPEGNIYTGSWIENDRRGYGTFSWSKGDKYEGYFANHKRFGHGIYTWPDGRKYVGNWDLTRYGKGTYTWPDGSTYTGRWNGGKREGLGTMTWHTGEITTGYWVDDKCKEEGNSRWHAFFCNGVDEQGIIVKNVMLL